MPAKLMDLANKYGVSRRTINGWVHSGNVDVTHNEVTGRIIWDEKSVKNLDDFVNRNNAAQEINRNLESLPEFTIGNRRYLGAKTRMLDFIGRVVEENTVDVHSIADIFGGTGSVANYFYEHGKDIVINDILDSNYMAYQTFFGNEDVDWIRIDILLRRMNELRGDENYVSRNYGDKFFSMENARKIGQARDFIDNQALNERERAVLLTSLFYAMDKVANTVGHYDAYRQVMDSVDPIVFRKPIVVENGAQKTIYHEDANQLVREITADLVYIDTPYNSRQYGDVYHVLENVIDWEQPELFGVAMKPKDRRRTKSDYSTAKAPQAFDDLIQHINARYILVSYNNMAKKGAGRSNAKISNEEIMQTLEKRGRVVRHELPFQVFTTGKTKVDNHMEYLYLVEVNVEAAND
ncbi:DNA adenine methylase [Weissella confusa]|uniref:DNA adenine methylase n=1 Tax=Weissella confusa TaxID=1583 RepID=UPI0022FDC061|nr:DNA adenine methylase [Weissella confusa]